jgi:hypothetical protein
LTEAGFESIKQSQGGLCAMCHEAEATVVDHEHDTGLVRALLCDRCNKALGVIEKYGQLAGEYLDAIQVRRAKALGSYQEGDKSPRRQVEGQGVGLGLERHEVAEEKVEKGPIGRSPWSTIPVPKDKNAGP